MDVLTEASKAIDNEQFDRAMDLLSAIVRKDPSQHGAWALLAKLETILGDEESAETCRANALDEFQLEIEAAERLVAHWKPDHAIEQLAGIWPQVCAYRAWNATRTELLS